MASPFTDNDFCFACGTRNPLGLQLQFYCDGGLFCTRFTPQPQWQGFAGVLHGGLQSTVLDDLMSNHLFRVEGVWAVTAELAMRFRRPVPLDRELLFTSRVTRRGGRLWELEGRCMPLDDRETELTTASGRFYEVQR